MIKEPSPDPVAEPAGADAEDREVLSDAECRDDRR